MSNTLRPNQTGVRLAILSLVVATAAGAVGAIAIATDDAGSPSPHVQALSAEPSATRNPFQAHISYVGTRADDCRIDDGRIRC